MPAGVCVCAGLYRGFGVYVVCGLPSQGVYYVGYNMAKHWLGDDDESSVLPAVAVHSIAALVADAAATPLWSPCEVIAKRMVVQGDTNPNYATLLGAWVTGCCWPGGWGGLLVVPA